MRQALTGTRKLFAVTLRQNLAGIAPWVLLLAALSVSSILSFVWVYDDEASRQDLRRQ